MKKKKKKWKQRHRGFERAAQMSWDNAAERLYQVYQEIKE